MTSLDYTVAFVGLPSSGKSSIINSLIFKRVLQSGVCRTTTEFKLIEEEVFDDDNNKFKVIDLPGICDSEETDNNFNDMIYIHIKNANLIIWVSDVHKAFITTHEVNEYYKLKKYIKDIENDTGRLYDVIIMLSKCDKDIITKKKVKSKINTAEIEDSDEDTDINDLVNKVKDKFKEEDIMLFNAYGRSYHHKKSSSVLKNFVSKTPGISNNNICFNISKYIVDIKKNQEESYYNKFLNIYKEYLTNDKVNEKLLSALTNLDCINTCRIINHLESIINYVKILEWNNFNNILTIEIKRIFDYIIYTNDIYDEFYDECDDSNDSLTIHFYSIKWFINIITICESNPIFTNNKSILILKPLPNFYTKDNLKYVIKNHYNILSLELKTIIYNDLLFTNTVTDLELNIDILKLLDRNEINFKKLFNDFIIKTTDINEFTIFYKKISKLIDINIQEDVDEFNNLISDTNNELLKISNIYKLCIKFCDKLLNNEDYILLRKIKSLHNMSIQSNCIYGCRYNSDIKTIRNCSKCRNCTWCYNILIDLHIVNHQNIICIYIPYHRLLRNLEFCKIINMIERKVYESLQVEDNKNILLFGIHNNNNLQFTPINRLELLYKLT